MPRSGRHVVLLAGAIAAFFVLTGLGDPPLHDWDEAWHAKIALDMQHGGHWWTYDFDGELESGARKPPLCFWMMRLAFHALGPTDLAVRLFSAVSFITLVMMTAGFAARYLNPSIALLSAGLLAMDPMLLFKHGARTGDMDAPLMLLLTLTVLEMWPARRTWPRAGAAAAYVGAWWIKAFAALQIAPVIIIWLVLLRRWRALAVALAWLSVGAASFLVYLAIRERFQPGVMHDTFQSEFHDRLTGQINLGRDPWFSYGKTIARSMLPILAAVGMVLAAHRGRVKLASLASDPRDVRPLVILLLLWWLLPLALFSISGTHYDWYLYPTYVPAYILLAWIIVAGLKSQASDAPRWVRVGVVLAVLLFASPSLWKLVHRSRTDQARAMEYRQVVSMLNSQDTHREVILYRPYPALRFELTRARIPHRVLNEPSSLAPVHLGMDRILIGRQEEAWIRECVSGAPVMRRILNLPASGYAVYQAEN